MLQNRTHEIEGARTSGYISKIELDCIALSTALRAEERAEKRRHGRKEKKRKEKGREWKGEY